MVLGSISSVLKKQTNKLLSTKLKEKNESNVSTHSAQCVVNEYEKKGKKV